MSFEARETLRSTWICAWLLRDSEAFETALFCSPRAHVRRFLLEWFFSRFSRSIIDISQSAGRKPGSTRIAQSQVTREIATCGSSDYISWLSARFPRDVSEWTRPDSRHKPQTFPHQKLTRKQLKLLDMCWTCVTCGYCIWSNDAEQFAWYDIHLCNWLHQETVWNYSTDLDSWFRGWHCGCSAVSRFIQDVRESKLSQLIHTVGRIFGACDQAYLSLNLGRTLILRLLQPDCPGTSVTMSELLRASWQPTSPQIVIFDMAAFCIPACRLRIRNSHLVMSFLSSSSLSHHFHLWCPPTNRTTFGCCHSRRTPDPSSR